MPKLVITGGAGFVGSNLAINFKKDFPEWDVVSLDNLKRRGSELILSRLKENNVSFLHGDIRNKEDLDFKFDFLIDCAAEPSILGGIGESPEYILNTNLVGTINILEAVRKNNAGMIFLSTSRIYPINNLNKINFIEEESRLTIAENQKVKGVSSLGISEEMDLNGHRTIYGATKLASELLINEYVNAYNIKAIINRCSNLVGPWQMGKVDQGFLSLWVARHVYGGELSYIGFEGKQVRDLLHIDDLYALIKLEITNLDKFSGKVFNVGGGVDLSRSLIEVTQICEKVTSNKVKIGIKEDRYGNIPVFITDTTKVIKETGWKPKKSPEETIKDIYDWILKYKEELRPILS